MPGLFIHWSSETDSGATEAACRALSHQGRFEVQRFPAAPCPIAATSAKPIGFSHHADADGIEAWVFGDCYALDGQPLTTRPAPEICRLVRASGANFVREFSGEFQVFALDRRSNQLHIANDRFGLRPWYLLETKKGFALAPEIKGLTSLLPNRPELDREILAGFLAFNKMRLGDRTMIRGISLLPPASLWTIDLAAKRLEKSLYWEFRYSDSMSEEPIPDSAVDDLIACYHLAMRHRSRPGPDRRVGISLSGGLDSRTMAAAVPQEFRDKTRAYTYGLEASDEVQLAAQVAKAAGLRHHIHPMGPEAFVKHAAAISGFADELDIFVQAAQADWLEVAAKDIDVNMTGVDLDVTLGGIYVVPEVLEAKTDADILSLIKARNAVFPEAELKALLSDAMWKDFGEAPYALAASMIADLPQESPAAKYDLFVHRFSMRRIIFLRYAMSRFWTETASPMYDYDFIDLICALPTMQRAGHRTFRRFLDRMPEAYSNIPYQRTMLPPAAPREFWARAAELERQREALYLEIWKETKGEVYVPYTRHYTNFDEWMRCHPDWMALTDDLLANDASRIYQLDIVNRDFVARRIQEQRNAEVSRRQQLICLMSLELWLRATF